MATATANLVMRNNTDAEFRAWGSTISGLLASCFGWVKCGDSGQIDWLTVLKPSLGSTKMGYEIWRFDDALQATAPVFMRIDFGSGSNSTNPQFWFTIGTGTDGAGNILPGGVETFAEGANNADGTSRTAYFSGAPGRGGWFTGLNPLATSGYCFFIERTKDATGADTADGVLITYIVGYPTQSTSWKQQYYQIGVGGVASENRLGILMPSTGSGISGGNTAIYPQWFGGRGPFLPYGMNLFGYFQDDIPAMVPIPITVYGATHTYLPLGTAMANAVTGATANKSTLMMRYE